MENEENKNNSKIIIPITIILLATAVATAVYLSGKVTQTETIENIPTSVPTQIANTPMPTIEPTPTATESARQIPEDWIEYKETGTSFTLFYPPDFEVRTNEDGSISFAKWGPTQTEGTELFDGISLTVKAGEYGEDVFSDYVEDIFAKAQLSSISAVRDLEEISLNGKSSYQYTEEGLGTFIHTYIPFEQKSYIHISTLVADPTNAGFQETTDLIISTIKYRQ